MCDAYQTAFAEMKKETPDLDLTMSLLVQSLEQGNPKAAYALGTWYLHGENVPRNLRKGIGLLRQAAKANVPDALYDLPICYEKGVGVPENPRMAFELYLRAALYGDKQSYYEVGRLYYYGIGVEKNSRISAIWLDKAHELGIDD